MTSPQPPSLTARGQATFQLWLVNVLVGAVVGTLWLVRVPETLTLWTRFYVGLALLSGVASLALAPGLLFFLIHKRMKRRWKLAGVLQAAIGTLFLGLVATDTNVYGQLGYHFNGAILNMAFNPESGDAVNLGWVVWTSVAIGLSLGIGLQYLVWHSSLQWLLRREEAGFGAPMLLQPRVVCLAFLIPAFGLEKSVYAAAHVQGDHELLTASNRLPVFPRVELGRVLDPEGTRVPALELFPEDATLSYPIAAPVLPEDGPRPNFFVLTLDSWRRDMFDDELTPNLFAAAEGSLRFDDHISSGNDTRFGLFTMLYGLHGTYWFRVLKEARDNDSPQPPAMIAALQEAGYEIKVFSAASMNFPALRETCWSTLPEGDVVDRFTDEDGKPRSKVSWEKDEFVAEAIEEWLDEREARGDTRPYFCFVLLDGTHQPYFNPGGPYQPSIERINYIKLGWTTDGPNLASLAEEVSNTYKNCVLKTDETAGHILDRLREAPDFDDTVLMVTGDHGEEFGENGFWGHTSNFAPEQVEVPMYLSGPGIEPGVVTKPTSHLDISNSLLELCGADPDASSDYSLGKSLFDPEEERARVIGGWGHLGIWTEIGIFDLQLIRGAERIDVYDRDWQPLADVPDRCWQQEDVLLRTADECNRFLAR